MKTTTNPAATYDSAFRVYSFLLRTYESYDLSVKYAHKAACAAFAWRLGFALQAVAS